MNNTSLSQLSAKLSDVIEFGPRIRNTAVIGGLGGFGALAGSGYGYIGGALAGAKDHSRLVEKLKAQDGIDAKEYVSKNAPEAFHIGIPRDISRVPGLTEVERKSARHLMKQVSKGQNAYAAMGKSGSEMILTGKTVPENLIAHEVGHLKDFRKNGRIKPWEYSPIGAFTGRQMKREMAAWKESGHEPDEDAIATYRKTRTGTRIGAGIGAAAGALAGWGLVRKLSSKLDGVIEFGFMRLQNGIQARTSRFGMMTIKDPATGVEALLDKVGRRSWKVDVVSPSTAMGGTGSSGSRMMRTLIKHAKHADKQGRPIDIQGNVVNKKLGKFLKKNLPKASTRNLYTGIVAKVRSALTLSSRLNSIIEFSRSRTEVAGIEDGKSVDIGKLIQILKDREEERLLISSIKGSRKDGGLSRSSRDGFSRKRLENTDISYPVIVDSEKTLINGRHRLIKLRDQMGRTHAKAVRATEEDIKRSIMGKDGKLTEFRVR